MAKRRKKTKQAFKIEGKKVKEKLIKIFKEGNSRRLIVKNKNRRILINLPLIFIIIAAIIAPALALISGVLILVTECTLTIEKKDSN